MNKTELTDSTLRAFDGSRPIKCASNGRPSTDHLLPLAAERLRYDADTGLLHWKTDTRLAKAGDVAGFQNCDGYTCVKIAGTKLRAHRVAWFIAKGEYPGPVLDHVNRDKSDNRIVNLRSATSSQNLVNARQRRSSSGRRGVEYCPRQRKWRARMKIKGQKISLGYYGTPEEASAAHRAAMVTTYGAFFDDSADAPRGGMARAA